MSEGTITTEKRAAAGSARSRKPSHLYRAEALLLVVVLIWALNFPVAKWALGELNYLVFNAIRYPLAALCVAVALPFGSAWRTVQRGDWKRLIGLGLLTNVLYQNCFIVGLSLTTAGNSAILLNTAPLWTVLLNTVLYKERLGPAIWGGMALSFVGVVMLIVGSGQQIVFGSRAVWGDLIMLAAAFLWALTTNVQKPLVNVYPSAQVTLISVGVGAMVLPLIAVPKAVTMDWSGVSWLLIAAAAASGIFSIGLAYFIWAHGVKRLGPARTAAFHNLVPVIAFTISYIFLRERYTALQVVGAAAALAGVWLARKRESNALAKFN